MRISDWSSDVCSSDLVSPDYGLRERLIAANNRRKFVGFASNVIPRRASLTWSASIGARSSAGSPLAANPNICVPGYHRICRSEEHTSELQSLMRISYAVFCLKKKKQHSTTHQHTNHH